MRDEYRKMRSLVAVHASESYGRILDTKIRGWTEYREKDMAGFMSIVDYFETQEFIDIFDMSICGNFLAVYFTDARYPQIGHIEFALNLTGCFIERDDSSMIVTFYGQDDENVKYRYYYRVRDTDGESALKFYNSATAYITSKSAAN